MGKYIVLFKLLTFFIFHLLVTPPYYLTVIGGYFTIPVYFSQFLEAILLFLAALSTMLTHRPALERLKEIRSEVRI